MPQVQLVDASSQFTGEFTMLTNPGCRCYSSANHWMGLCTSIKRKPGYCLNGCARVPFMSRHVPLLIILYLIVGSIFHKCELALFPNAAVF